MSQKRKGREYAPPSEKQNRNNRGGAPSIATGLRVFQKTCAACDYVIEGDPIKVTVGGEIVEVCCEDCARKLKEADQSAKAAGRN